MSALQRWANVSSRLEADYGRTGSLFCKPVIRDRQSALTDLLNHMHGVSPDLNLSFCLDTPIVQIAVGKFDVQFHFGNGAQVIVQGDVEIYRDRALLGTWRESSGWTSVAFQEILNISVDSIDIPNDRRIDFHLANGLMLSLFDTSDQFESMQIYSPVAGAPMIVV